MSKNYPGIGKVRPQDKTLRKWFSKVLEQTGGITRYVMMLNEREKDGITYTEQANKLFVEMLDKHIKLEPKESTQENTITIQLEVPKTQRRITEGTVDEVVGDIEYHAEEGTEGDTVSGTV